VTGAPFLSLPPGGLAPAAVWWLTASDGVRLRAAHWRAEAPQAMAVLLSGRTEFLEKMAVPAAQLVARGYDVVSIDWRGQGLSDRHLDEELKGHVEDFAEFQRDLDALLASDPVRAAGGGTLLMAHSMGGAIATGALMRPDLAGRFDAAVLCAPMYGIALNAPMRAAAWLTRRLGMALGHDEKWPPFGDVATPYVLTAPDPNVLTHDQDIWDWLVRVASEHDGLNLAMPTLGWFDAAEREMDRLARGRPVVTPALCLLGGEEAVVDPARVRATSAALGIELAPIEGGRHELLVEAPAFRDPAWAAIDRFLAARGLPAG
jgi:lysophospholipase